MGFCVGLVKFGSLVDHCVEGLWVFFLRRDVGQA